MVKETDFDTKIDNDRPNAIKALTAKGFTVHEAKSEDEFLREIHNYDQAWFTSSGVASSKPEKVDESSLILMCSLYLKLRNIINLEEVYLSGLIMYPFSPMPILY